MGKFLWAVALFISLGLGEAVPHSCLKSLMCLKQFYELPSRKRKSERQDMDSAVLPNKYRCDPKLCSDICGTTGVEDFTSFSCNPFTCKCYCNNPPPPNCLPDNDGRCDAYCKQTYCASYFGILCGSYDNPVCTCACNPYGPYLRNSTREISSPTL